MRLHGADVHAKLAGMKNLRAPWIVLGLLYALFYLYLAQTAQQLPVQVATHFDGHGQPNGWMSQAGYVMFTGVFAVCVPGLIVMSCALVRVLPVRLVNIPNREYWLAPERLEQTGRDMFRYGLWLACVIVAFLGGVHGLIIEANRHVPPHLSTPAMLGLLVWFAVGMGLWFVALRRRFRKVV
jgi:uncharacterized membrane protein